MKAYIFNKKFNTFKKLQLKKFFKGDKASVTKYNKTFTHKHFVRGKIPFHQVYFYNSRGRKMKHALNTKELHRLSKASMRIGLSKVL